MTKLELVLERVRRLPSERQEAIAFEIDLLLREEAQGGFLSEAQWADLRERMAAPQGDPIPHEEIVAEMETKFRS